MDQDPRYQAIAKEYSDRLLEDIRDRFRKEGKEGFALDWAMEHSSMDIHKLADGTLFINHPPRVIQERFAAQFP